MSRSVARHRAFLVLLLAISSTGVFAQGHCSSGEVTYFSCKIESSEKYVSVCGSAQLVLENDKLNTVGWLQYRFGKLGRPELIFPQNKKKSLRKFSGDYESLKAVKHFWYDLSFQSGSASYQVGVGFGDLGGYYGLRVSSQRKVTELPCEGFSYERFHYEGDSNSIFSPLVRALKDRVKNDG